MTESANNDPPDNPPHLADQVQKKAERRHWAQSQDRRSVWFGFGMFGLIGWAVAIPTILGITLGIWLDRHWPAGQISWTISLLFVGIILGCLNAWRWVNRERQLESRPGLKADNKAGEKEK